MDLVSDNLRFKIMQHLNFSIMDSGNIRRRSSLKKLRLRKESVLPSFFFISAVKSMSLSKTDNLQKEKREERRREEKRGEDQTFGQPSFHPHKLNEQFRQTLLAYFAMMLQT